MEHLSLFRMDLLGGSTYTGIILTGFLSTTWEILASKCYFMHLSRLTESISHIKTLSQLIWSRFTSRKLNGPCSSQNCMMTAKMNELFNSFTDLKHQSQIFCCSVTLEKFIRWMIFLSKKTPNPSKKEKRLCLLFRAPLPSLVISWCLQSDLLEPGQTWINSRNVT